MILDLLLAAATGVLAAALLALAVVALALRLTPPPIVPQRPAHATREGAP